MRRLDLDALRERWLAALGLADPRVTLATLVDPAVRAGVEDPQAIPVVSVRRGMWLLTRLADVRLPESVVAALEARGARYLGDLVTQLPEWLEANPDLSPSERRALLKRLSWARLRPPVTVHGWPPANAEALCRFGSLPLLTHWRRWAGRSGSFRPVHKLGRAVPAWAASLLGDVRLLGIGDRLARRLKAGGFDHVGDLVRTTEAELARAAGLDADAVRVVDRQLASRGLSFGMTLPGWPPSGLAILAGEAAAYFGSSRSSMPRLGRKVVWTRADPARARPATRGTPERPKPPATLDEEIQWLLDFATFRGQREAAAACFGWDGRPPRQQAEVAARLGVSLMRVQQLCQHLRRRWAAAAPATPRLEAALREVAAFRAATVEEVASRLPRTALGLEGILAAWRALGRPSPPRLATVGGRRVVLQGRAAPLAGRVRRFAAHAVWARGLATPDEVRAALARSSRLTVSRGFVEAALAGRPDVQWLGTPDGAFSFIGSRPIPLVRRILKILGVAGRASIDVIADGIRRSERGARLVADPDLLLAMCARVPGLRVHGQEVSLVAHTAVPRRVGHTEATIAERLRQLGRPASMQELVDWSSEVGIKPQTAKAYLRISPMFGRVLEGYYALRGEAGGPWGPVEPDAGRPVAGGAPQGGWLPDGRAWVAFVLTPRGRASGRLAVPAALAATLGGEYDIRVSGDRLLGRIAVTREACAGLLPLYRLRKLCAGHVVALVFDLATRIVRCGASRASFRVALDRAVRPNPRLRARRGSPRRSA
jgi:hypothetical protein